MYLPAAYIVVDTLDMIHPISVIMKHTSVS